MGSEGANGEGLRFAKRRRGPILCYVRKEAMLCYAMLCYAMLCYAMLCKEALSYVHFSSQDERFVTSLAPIDVADACGSDGDPLKRASDSSGSISHVAPVLPPPRWT